jgi:cation:H+ antiporter
MVPMVAVYVFLLGVALFILVRGADLFVSAARHIGLSAGMSKFSIGVFIVGFGTSIPELASAISAALKGETAIVLANAVGSNVTNILLIMGVLAAIGGKIVVQRDLIKAELPVFFVSIALFFMCVIDGVVDRVESFLLVGTFAAYLWYFFVEAPKEDSVVVLRKHHRNNAAHFRHLFFALLGLIGILVGAHYSVLMVIEIAEAFEAPLGIVSITAIALSTSLPELFVSLRAVRDKEAAIAIGNLFGSNIFNLLIVIGIPGLIVPLMADDTVRVVGIPVLLAASAIIFVHGLAKQILRWEGIMFILFYIVFIIKLYSLA